MEDRINGVQEQAEDPKAAKNKKPDPKAAKKDPKAKDGGAPVVDGT
jgi:hypothetical protein